MVIRYGDYAKDLVQGSNPVKGKGVFSSPKRSHRLWAPPRLLFCGHRGSFPGLELSPPSSAEVKNQWSHTSLILLCRYNSDTVLAFSTISFHLRRSCTCSAHFISFIFFTSFLTSSSHRDLGLHVGLPVNGFHLCILSTMLVSEILFTCPNQLSLWALT